MSPFTDPAKSGIYRAADFDAARAAAEEAGLTVATVVADEEDVLDSIAGAFGFPEWFGGNLDALEDSLSDLSWLPSDRGWALFLSCLRRQSAEERKRLREVLESVAKWWPSQGRAFYVVIDDSAWDVPQI